MAKIQNNLENKKDFEEKDKINRDFVLIKKHRAITLLRYYTITLGKNAL